MRFMNVHRSNLHLLLVSLLLGDQFDLLRADGNADGPGTLAVLVGSHHIDSSVRT